MVNNLADTSDDEMSLDGIRSKQNHYAGVSDAYRYCCIYATTCLHRRGRLPHRDADSQKPPCPLSSRRSTRQRDTKRGEQSMRRACFLEKMELIAGDAKNLVLIIKFD